jgi:hypothetical protein
MLAYLKIDRHRYLAQVFVFISLRPGPLYCICSQHNMTPPVTHCMNTLSLYLFTRGRGEGGEEGVGKPVKGRVALVHKRGRKYQQD